MLCSSDPESGLKILKAGEILHLLDKIYTRLAYGTQTETDIAVNYIAPAYSKLKEYWNIKDN